MKLHVHICAFPQELLCRDRSLKKNKKFICHQSDYEYIIVDSGLIHYFFSTLNLINAKFDRFCLKDT